MISLVLAAIMLFCLGFSLCTHAKESGDYLIFGDSITTGYGLADKTMRFATLISKKLGIAERNYGVDGATSADLLTKINGSDEIKRAIAGAEFISVSIGGNDLLDKYKYILPQALGLDVTDHSAEIDATYAAFDKNLRAIFAAIREQNHDCKVYIQTLYNPYGDLTVMDRYNAGTLLDPYIIRLNNIIRTRAAEKNCAVVDVAAALNGNKACFSTASNISAQDIWALMNGTLDYTKFDFHPSAVGHAEIAKLLEKHIAADYPQFSESEATTETTATTSTTATTTSATTATTSTTTAATTTTTATSTTATTATTATTTTEATTTEATTAETTATTATTTTATTAAITTAETTTTATKTTSTTATTAQSTSGTSSESGNAFAKVGLPIICIIVLFGGAYAVYAVKKKQK